MEALWIGLALGTAAGFSPGPLMTLVVTVTLERGLLAGLRVAAAPLLTDIPVVAVALWAAAAMPLRILHTLAIFGGAFVISLGLKTLVGAPKAKLHTDEELPAGGAIKDLLSGALINILSPHPWIFWLGIGAPQVVELRRGAGLKWAVAFLVLFYAGLVGSKMLLAVGVARGRRNLNETWYRRILTGCAILLVVLGFWLGYDGLRGWSAAVEGAP